MNDETIIRLYSSFGRELAASIIDLKYTYRREEEQLFLARLFVPDGHVICKRS